MITLINWFIELRHGLKTHLIDTIGTLLSIIIKFIKNIYIFETALKVLEYLKVS